MWSRSTVQIHEMLSPDTVDVPPLARCFLVDSLSRIVNCKTSP